MINYFIKIDKGMIIRHCLYISTQISITIKEKTLYIHTISLLKDSYELLDSRTSAGK